MDNPNPPQPTQTSPSTTSVPPSQPFKPAPHKHFVLFGLIGLILVVGAVGWYFMSHKPVAEQKLVPPTQPTPTTDPTAGWQTYTGEDYSFKYPADWKILNKSLGTTGIVTLQKETQMASAGAFPAQTLRSTISVHVSNVQEIISLDSWLKMRYHRRDDNLFGLTKESSKKTKLGGVEAISVQVPGGAGYLDEGTVAVNQNKGYDVSIIGSEIEGALDAYHGIVNTFKFTDSMVTRDQVEGLVRKKVDSTFSLKSYKVVIDSESDTTWGTSVFDTSRPGEGSLVGWFAVIKSTGEVKQGTP